jgi:hypothetical protein
MGKGEMHMTPYEWKDMTIGKSYDQDKAYGYQCWDYFDAFVKYFKLPVSTYCSLTGYVCDLWRLKDKYGYSRVFYYVQPGEPLRTGDWCIWDKGSSHPSSHIAMYYNGQGLGQNQGAPYVNEKPTTWDVMGALRLKTWALDIPPGSSDLSINGHLYSVYRQGAGETFAVLSAGLNKTARIQDLNADVWVMAKATGANYFQMKDGQADPVNTTYGCISSPLNDVWTETPNQNTTLFFDYDTGVYGDCTGVHVDMSHNVASPAVVYPAAGNYQYARMVGIDHVNTRSRYTFAVRFKDGTYLAGIASQDMTPAEIATDWRTVPELETIQFFDGGGSAQFGRWNGSAFEYVRDTGRATPSAFAIVSTKPYKPETEPTTGENEKDEEQSMEEQKTPTVQELTPVEGWTDPEPNTATTIKDRISALLSVKSIITLAFVGTYLAMVLQRQEVPNLFENILTMIVSFFFGYQFRKAEK